MTRALQEWLLGFLYVYNDRSKGREPKRSSKKERKQNKKGQVGVGIVLAAIRPMGPSGISASDSPCMEKARVGGGGGG